jgi:hypothetical protein
VVLLKCASRKCHMAQWTQMLPHLRPGGPWLHYRAMFLSLVPDELKWLQRFVRHNSHKKTIWMDSSSATDLRQAAIKSVTQ